MSEIKEIHDFAVKYRELYKNPQTLEYEVLEGFDKLCFLNGFEMDCGKRFINTFSSEAFYNYEEFDKVIDGIYDISLLGSAIFSYWRYITHWSYGESLLDKKNRQWFIAAFNRLAKISDKLLINQVVFEGKLQKIQLRTNILQLGFIPYKGREIEQRLTITADGKVWFSRYGYGESAKKYDLIEKTNYTISKSATDSIFMAISSYFCKNHNTFVVKDAGIWDLTLTNTEGRTFKFIGCLPVQTQNDLTELSDIIRTNLECQDVFAFDDNPNFVTRIEISYHRRTKVNFSNDPDIIDYIIWEYDENFTIDLFSGTLKLIRKINPEYCITNTYSMPNVIQNIFNDISLNIFSEIEENPPDAVDNPLSFREYAITIFTKYGEVRHITGSFDKNGLPADWCKFIENIYDLIAFYGIGEIFDAKIYNKAKRRKSDIIYCNVSFEEFGKTYCYIADSDDYCIGDFVIVPAGVDNHEALVRIESIDYYSADKVPYPLEKTKHILRKYIED